MRPFDVYPPMRCVALCEEMGLSCVTEEAQ